MDRQCGINQMGSQMDTSLSKTAGRGRNLWTNEGIFGRRAGNLCLATLATLISCEPLHLWFKS